MRLCCVRIEEHLNDDDITAKLRELNLCRSIRFSAGECGEVKNDKRLRLLGEIIHGSTRPQLQAQNPRELIDCAIGLLKEYEKLAPSLGGPLSSRKHKRKYQRAKDIYAELLKAFVSQRQEEIIKIVVDVIQEGKLWQSLKVCLEAIESLFKYGYDGLLIYHEVCNKIELPENSIDASVKSIVNILCALFDAYDWPETEATASFLKRVLDLYYASLQATYEEARGGPRFANLKSGLELCVRYIVENATNRHLLVIIHHMGSWLISDNVNESIIQNYGSTLEYAAYAHKGEPLARTLTLDILSLLMQMIGSSVGIVSLLGNRVLQYLIDRGKNMKLFDAPKIFIQEVPLELAVVDYYEDVDFIKEHRELIHSSLIKSFVNHRDTRLNLEATYCTACLLAIEVPCGFTAAALSCLMMNLQAIIMKKTNQFGKEASYHIHAIVISVLSFVCWIHDAKDFHAYVNKVALERAKWAPHLNPPLKSNYHFAEHHILWNKSELFLVEWEVRYGLWKRFRLNESAHLDLRPLKPRSILSN